MLKEKMEMGLYHLQKLHELISDSGMDFEMVKDVHYEHLKKDFIEYFKKAVIEKYGSLDAVIGIKSTLEKIDYVIRWIDHFLEKRSGYDKMEATIMLYAFGHLYEELIKYAAEMDDEV